MKTVKAIAGLLFSKMLIAAPVSGQQGEKVGPASAGRFRFRSKRRFRLCVLAAVLMFPSAQQSWSVAPALSGAGLPQWTYTLSYGTKVTILGTDPSSTDTPTTIPVEIIPIRMSYQVDGGTLVFDPNATYPGLNEVASWDTFGGSALIVGNDGQLYGTGVQNGGCGVVFKLSPSTGQFTTLHQFTGLDGCKPLALLQGIDGNLYGVTEEGGGTACTNGCGEVFEMDSSSGWTPNVIYPFLGGNAPYQPYYLIQGDDGTLYGLTYLGNNGGPGAIFSVTTSGSGFNVLHSFQYSDGADPAALLPPYSGVLYGASPMYGPNGNGEIFSLNTDGSGFTIVHPFTGGSDGATPVALARTNTGTLYGVAQAGPTSGCGTSGNFPPGEIFQVEGGSANPQYCFPNNGSQGTLPNSLTYVQFGTGFLLLGTTVGGGAGNAGVIFGYNPSNPANCIPGNSTNCSFTLEYSLLNGLLDPNLPLVRGKNGGSIYGATAAGGAYNSGTVFKLLSATQLVATSPLFEPLIDYQACTDQGCTDLGKTQYEDAYMRGGFWQHGVQTNSNWHLLLGQPTIESERSIGVTAAEGNVTATPCTDYSGPLVGTVQDAWFRSKLQADLAKIPGVQPNTLPIFIIANVFPIDLIGRCVGGRHRAIAGPPNGQTYVYSTIMPQGVFAEDIDILSHEIGEWIMDPFITNSSPCGLLTHIEVGDPLEGGSNFGTHPYVVNGFTYHPQDLVFTPYFGDSLLPSVNGWWSFQDYGFTGPCEYGP